MWFERISPIAWDRADEGEGATGGEGAEGGAEDQGGTGADEGDGGEKASSILDFASKGDSENSEGDWKLPDGLELPDHLVGSNADDTLAKLAKAYSGARRELSQKGKGEGLSGDVPETPDGYTFEPEGEDDRIAAELNSEASKPVLDYFRKAAHEIGIPAQAFQELMRKGLGAAAEAGIPIGVSNEEAAKISGEAEFAALSQEVGAKEAGTIINTISAYQQKLADRGVLSGEEDMAEFAQMMGTARAARIFHRILTGELGERPIPVADGVDGAVTGQEAYAAHAAASRMPPGAEKDAAMAEAQRKMQKAFGNNGAAAGSVRSSVL